MEIRFLIIISAFVVFSKFIKIYNRKLIKMHKDYYPCYDIMNQKITSIIGFNMCLWNFIHIILYCLLCFLFNAGLDVKRHFLVFIIGLSWLLLSPYKEINNKHKKCSGTVYEDTFIPRNDDLFFNTLGQVIYIVLIKFSIMDILFKKNMSKKLNKKNILHNSYINILKKIFIYFK